ncbi:hypothetical protein MSAN_01616900 [Mycena sanguinolenta]|uniref:Uncharacterized protein n=1 Tax=Mycena sanguinolenta TaxID=230812 RepID=A0A8H6Y225_9AGAR|nr:hypothetical protein MSAN_01616900 [Mycena sanguinolenta]
MPSFPDLPTEILMEIVSHYSPLIHGVPTGERFAGDTALHAESPGFIVLETVNESLVGNETLRALSQTSRIFRAIFLPVLWARFHACFTEHNGPKRKIKTRAKMLERRMKGIQKTPYIVPYIRSLSVTLTECNTDNWQPMAEFIRVLDLLTNLKDLTILSVRSQMVEVLSTSCKGKVFSSVSRLALDNNLAPIMASFPNIHTLTFIWTSCIDVLQAVKESCKQIETINHFSLSPEVVQCLRDAVPNVRRLMLWSYYGLSKLSLLEGMEALSELRINHRPLYHPYGHFNARQLQPLSQGVVAAAKRVLHTSKAVERKRLRIYEIASGGLPKETLIDVGAHL